MLLFLFVSCCGCVWYYNDLSCLFTVTCCLCVFCWFVVNFYFLLRGCRLVIACLTFCVVSSCDFTLWSIVVFVIVLFVVIFTVLYIVLLILVLIV